MMPHIIPGGRQRASSDGDVLEDEDDTINASGILDRLTEAHRNVSRSAILSTDDDRDSESTRSTTESDKVSKNKKKTLRSKISFKSVKKAVKGTLFGSTSSLNKEEMPASVKASSASGVWTPMRRTVEDENDRFDGHHGHRPNGDSAVTDSVSRPLVTDPGQLISKWNKTPGNVGLENHGNTCFMNAVLQCLSHTDSFTEYFVTGLYKDDLKNSRNSSKKQGNRTPSKGDVTEQLGVLLKCLWSDRYTKDISSEFKTIVGKYNDQYKGSSQHDAQEFLLWLLDRVHDEVAMPQTKKKSKQIKIGNSNRPQTDEELAEAAESGLTTSFVSKLFRGLHRSSLTCPHCNKHSNTFDPYLCVSLPLPQKCLRPVYVVVVTLQDPQQSVMIGLSLNMYDTIRELREAVSNDMEIPVEHIVLCDLARDGFYATFSNEQPLSDIPEDCYVYAVEMHAEEEQQASRDSGGFESGTIQLLLLHVEKRRNANQRFCQPEVVQISREEDVKGLQKEILIHMGAAVKKEVMQQNLRPLFQLQIVDGRSRKSYLPLDVEMPLYTQSVDNVLSMFSEEFGPQHLKLIVEWEPEVKEAVIVDDEEHIVEHSSVASVRAVAQQPVKVSLEECFQLYTQEEKLAGEDAWHCPHCKKAQRGATKTLGLWSLPDVLVLHLKRFKQTGMRRNKLNTLVEFPVEDLDMASHIVQHRNHDTRYDNTTYDLIGVTNHYGNMMGGHYTAYCKNTVDGAWQEFDDRRLGPRTPQHVVSNSAYILFYQRRSLSKLVNQQIFTGQHWVFNLFKKTSDKSLSSSPQRRRSGEGGSPGKKYAVLQEDLENIPPSNFERKVYSKEWNGQSSPRRRLPNRSLTPQPHRRQPFEMSSYDASPTGSKQRPPSFQVSRPTLSRQLSDAALRAKKHVHEDAVGKGEARLEPRGEPRYVNRSSSGATSPPIQAQALQVSLPPKGKASKDGDAPRNRNSDILQQPEQVLLPSPRDSVRPLSSTSQSFKMADVPCEVMTSIVNRDNTSAAKSPRSVSPHTLSQPPSVDVRVVEPIRVNGRQMSPNTSSSSQRDQYVSPTGRPWQYESQSSHSSRDTQSSQDSQHSHSSPRGPDMSRSPRATNGTNTSKEFYDWRQPEARADRVPDRHSAGGSPAKPATAILSRVMNKPPLPPKILTRPPDSRTSSEGSASSSPLHKQDDRLGPASGPSLTSPPSPAPKDSHRRLTNQEIPRVPREEPPPAKRWPPEQRVLAEDKFQQRVLADEKFEQRMLAEERFISLNDPSAPTDYGGEMEVRRRKPRDSQIQGDQITPRRRSQNLAADQKFFTIARGNRDAHSEPRDVPLPAMVPRSSTDHSIHFHSRASPNHLVHSPRLSAYAPLNSGIPGRQDWERTPAPETVANMPMYARETRVPEEFGGGVVNRDSRHQVYRGPMFQRPPRRSSSNAANIPTPDLRESSV